MEIHYSNEMRVRADTDVRAPVLVVLLNANVNLAYSNPSALVDTLPK